MIEFVRWASIAFVVVSMSGCQTASLEDAAPKAASVTATDDASVVATTTDAADTADATDTGAPDPAASPPATTVPAAKPVVEQRNPGITSIIPLEKTAPVKTEDFVAEGANRTGRFPTFGEEPKAANKQFSDAEKLAAEAQMTELLRARASTPDARRQYEARLKQLRALAATHGAVTQQEIEN